MNPFDSIEVLAAALARGATSSEAIVRLSLDRIARLDAKLHAFSAVFPERALAQARAADAARAAGRVLGPLHGIPLAVKDIFDVADHPTTAGSRALTDRHPQISAHAVARLEAAGMIVVGKTHMVELAYGGWGTNPVMGAPWNPWKPEMHHVAGGSSSGSAVAVAAGLVPAALGTDTGGSIRTPATWCGIVGLKTSQGLVGRGGAVPLAPTHDTVGPMARTVGDAALLLGALAGFDPADATTAGAPPIDPMSDLDRGVAGLRIGVLSEGDLAGVEPGVRALHDQALGELTALGARIEEVRLPLSIAAYLGRGGEIMSVESYAHLGAYVDAAGSPVDPVIAARIGSGRTISGPRYYQTLLARKQAQIEFARRIDRLDAVLAPGSHRTAIPLAAVDEAVPPNIYGRVVNYLDLASLAVPVGRTAEGLPAGVQIMVRRFDDAMALRIGRALELATGGFSPPD